MNFYKPRYKHVVRSSVPFLTEKKKKLLTFTRLKWRKIKKIYNIRYRYKKVLSGFRFSLVSKNYIKRYKNKTTKKKQKKQLLNSNNRRFRPKYKKKKRLKPFILYQHGVKYRGKKYNRIRPLRSRRFLKQFYIIKERCCLYFGRDRFSYSKFRRLALFAKRISSVYKKNYACIFHHKLESRLIFFLVRLGFISSQYEAKYLISSKLVTNLEGVKFPNNYFLRKGDFITFDKGLFYIFYRYFLSKNFFFFLNFHNLKKRKKIFTLRKKRFFFSAIDLDLCKSKGIINQLLFLKNSQKKK